MTESWMDVDGPQDSPVLLIADHASAHVPRGLNLGVTDDILGLHIASDIGVEALGRVLCARGEHPGILGAVSRLVIDLNREEDALQLIPTHSDGIEIPGNELTPKQRAERITRFFRPYHARIAAQIRRQRPRLLVSLHSFTPQLDARPEEQRPWQIGVLYNQDDRAARLALPLLYESGLCIGDQQPYSGVILNATMNRHGEANGIAYLGLEVRQDMLADDVGIAQIADILVPVIAQCAKDLGDRT